MDSFHSKVVGVSCNNIDGKSRQVIIKKYCNSGMPLVFISEPNNKYDGDAIAVFIEVKRFFSKKLMQIGYLNSDLAGEITRKLSSGIINNLNASILEVTGGTVGKKNLGVNIIIVMS